MNNPDFPGLKNTILQINQQDNFNLYENNRKKGIGMTIRKETFLRQLILNTYVRSFTIEISQKNNTNITMYNTEIYRHKTKSFENNLKIKPF